MLDREVLAGAPPTRASEQSSLGQRSFVGGVHVALGGKGSCWDLAGIVAGQSRDVGSGQDLPPSLCPRGSGLQRWRDGEQEGVPAWISLTRPQCSSCLG